MSETAAKRMSADEFLRWDDGTDTRYELIAGFPVAMTPPARAHGILCARLAGMIDTALRPHARVPHKPKPGSRRLIAMTVFSRPT